MTDTEISRRAALVPGCWLQVTCVLGPTTSVAILQHADRHGPERPVLLAVAEELGDGRAHLRPSTKYTRSHPSIGGVLPGGEMTVGRSRSKTKPNQSVRPSRRSRSACSFTFAFASSRSSVKPRCSLE